MYSVPVRVFVTDFNIELLVFIDARPSVKIKRLSPNKAQIYCRYITKICV